MAKEFKITSLRLADLEKELTYLKTTREREIAAMIAEARSYGDLSENSEYDAAVTVGEKTFGKGYFQNTFELSDGSAVTLSIGKYYTPNGESLAGVGLTPDVEVLLTEEEAAKLQYGTLPVEEDPQIQAAFQAIKSGKRP